MYTRQSAKRGACDPSLGPNNGQHRVRVALDPNEIFKRFKGLTVSTEGEANSILQTTTVF